MDIALGRTSMFEREMITIAGSIAENAHHETKNVAKVTV